MSRLAILRSKVVLARHGPALVLCFALVGTALLGGAGWAYANPPTTEVTTQTNEQTIRSEIHTSAVTTGNSSLYRPGTRLTDQPVYLLSSSPSVTLTQRTTVPEARPVRIEQRMTLRYRVSRDGSVFWEESHLLTRNETTTSTGELVTNTSVDIRGIRARLTEIQSEIGRAGAVRAQLVVAVSYETDQYDGELTEVVPVELTDTWYAVEASPVERTHGVQETRTVPLPTRNPLGYLLPAGIGLSLLAAAGAVAIGHHRGFDRPRLERRVQELRYTDWISTGSVSDLPTDTTISIDSLEGLVDIAIDTDSRVIRDEGHDVYVVISDSVLYYYGSEEFL